MKVGENDMKVSVIAPHMDDEVLGVGGTIVKHVLQGDEVSVCMVANRAYGHQYLPEMINKQKEAALKARDILGYGEAVFLDLNDELLDEKIINIVVPLEEYINRAKPDIVYINHFGDSNQDHQAVFKAAIIACRTFATSINRLLCYETLSSTEQAPPFGYQVFMPNYYVNIAGNLDTKIKALECYDDELRQFPHPRSAEGIRILAAKRGMEIGFKSAEAFAVVRERWE